MKPTLLFYVTTLTLQFVFRLPHSAHIRSEPNQIESNRILLFSVIWNFSTKVEKKWKQKKQNTNQIP